MIVVVLFGLLVGHGEESEYQLTAISGICFPSLSKVPELLAKVRNEECVLKGHWKPNSTISFLNSGKGITTSCSARTRLEKDCRPESFEATSSWRRLFSWRSPLKLAQLAGTLAVGSEPNLTSSILCIISWWRLVAWSGLAVVDNGLLAAFERQRAAV